MQIRLSDIIEREEPVVEIAPEEEALSLSLPEEDGCIRRLEGGGLRFIREVSDRLVLQIIGEAELVTPCSRCLKDVEVRVPIDAEYVFRIEEGVCVEDPEDTPPALSDGVLEVDAAFLSEIRQALPSKVLCRADCKGLCPKCGQDLNAEECGCDRFVPDPRMQGIWDVFKAIDDKKEV